MCQGVADSGIIARKVEGSIALITTGGPKRWLHTQERRLENAVRADNRPFRKEL